MASTFLNLPVETVGTVLGPVEVAISAATDSIRVSDGTDTLAINADGSINANITGSVTAADVVVTGVNEFEFGESLGVAAGATVTVVSRLFPSEYKLRRVSATGTNIATYSVLFGASGVDKKRATYTNFNCEFDYETGITIPAGTTVSVEVENAGASIGDFSAQLLFSAK